MREWSDLISALAKVQKTLAHKRFTPAMIDGVALHLIPAHLSIDLAKRLAQCLNRGLPSGVHLKALEVAAQIFERLGPAGLLPQLSIWSMGILPVFQHASSKVKPLVLDLVRRWYLPLGSRLIPALPGLLLALLPGLEEDAGESRDQVLEILEKVRVATETRVFMRCLWRLLLTCPQIRLAAVNYLTVALPKPTAFSYVSSSSQHPHPSGAASLLSQPSTPNAAPASSPVCPTSPPTSTVLHLSRFLSSPPRLSIQALLAALHARENVLCQRKVMELILAGMQLKEPHATIANSAQLTYPTVTRKDSLALPTSAATHAPVPSPSPSHSPTTAPSQPPIIGSVLSLDEQVQLLDGALDILLLQDVSLSRRLFIWLLQPSGPLSNSSTIASNTSSPDIAPVPSHSLMLLLITFRRMLISVVPSLSRPREKEEEEVKINLPHASPSANLSMLLRPFQLLSLLLDREEFAHSRLVEELHGEMMWYVFHTERTIRRLDAEAHASGGASGSDQRDSTISNVDRNTASSTRRLNKHVSRWRSATGSTNSSSAMDHIHAFYSQVPIKPVWQMLQMQTKNAREKLLAASASSDSLPHATTTSSSTDSPVSAASLDLTLHLRLLDFACDFLPSTFPLPQPTPTSAVGYTPASATPAAFTPFTPFTPAQSSTLQRGYPSNVNLLLPSRDWADFREIAAEAVECCFSLMKTGECDAAAEGLQTCTEKLLGLAALQSHFDSMAEMTALSSPASPVVDLGILANDVLQSIVKRLPEMMEQLRTSSAEEDARLDCVDLLLRLTSRLLGFDEEQVGNDEARVTPASETGPPTPATRPSSLPMSLPSIPSTPIQHRSMMSSTTSGAWSGRWRDSTANTHGAESECIVIDSCCTSCGG